MPTPDDTLSSIPEDPSGWTLSQIVLLLLAIPSVSATIIGNLFVILSWVVSPSIRTPSNGHLLALAVVDLFLGATVMPLGFTYMINGGWIFGSSDASRIFCKFQISCNYGLTFLSANHLVLIALDRYHVLFDGLQYLGRRQLRHVLESSGLLWILAIWMVSPICILIIFRG